MKILSLNQSSDDSSEYIRSGTSAGLRKVINKEVKKILHKQKGKGGGGLSDFLEKLVAQERRVAMLERQSANNSGESGLKFILDFKIIQQSCLYM